MWNTGYGCLAETGRRTSPDSDKSQLRKRSSQAAQSQTKQVPRQRDSVECAKANKAMTRGALSLAQQCQAAGLPVPEKELRFLRSRRWKFDFAWPDYMLACEIEGGTFMAGGSRHSRGVGFEKDCEKYAEAAIRGWRVLRVTTKMVNDGRALGYLERLLT